MPAVLVSVVLPCLHVASLAYYVPLYPHFHCLYGKVGHEAWAIVGHVRLSDCLSLGLKNAVDVACPVEQPDHSVACLCACLHIFHILRIAERTLRATTKRI